MARLQLAVVALLIVAACSNHGASADASAEALLGGTSMADTPWPSDAFLHDGHVQVNDVLIEGGQPGPLGTLAASLSELDGASAYTSVFFPVQGELADGAIDGTARWIDLDAPNVETAGKLFYRKDTHELVALAPQGVVHQEGHHIACVAGT